MKKLLAAMIIGLATVGLVGCGGKVNTESEVLPQIEGEENLEEVVEDITSDLTDGIGDVIESEITYEAKDYEYNHVFDDIINDAAIIDVNYLQMTSLNQVKSVYGEGEAVSAAIGGVKYPISDDGVLYVRLNISSGTVNIYRMYFYDENGRNRIENINKYMEESGKWNINENFSCDYCEILYGNRGSAGEGYYINFIQDEMGEFLVHGHTYEEIAELFGNKGMLFDLNDKYITVLWYFESGERYIMLGFDLDTQECTPEALL